MTRARPEQPTERPVYTHDTSFEPAWAAPRRTGPGRRRRWIVVAVVGVLLLVLGGVYLLPRIWPPMCGPGVARIADTAPGPSGGPRRQCIGVTDGSVTDLASDPAFTTVLTRIRDENARVLADPATPVVSVAYVVPIPAVRQMVSRQFVRELEGAYLVQLQRNERGQRNVLGGTPRLQLLVANIGQDGQYAAPVVERLAELTEPGVRAPLVAVAGLDQSLDGVRDAIGRIGRLGVPMVGARITGDDVSTDPSRDGFFAVSPPVSAQVDAIVGYLGPQPDVLVVEDRAGGDLYGPALAGRFRARFGQVPGAAALPAPVPFDSGRAGAQTAINQVNAAICTLRPRAVFYAGRGSNLPDLVRTLGTRACRDVPVDIVTGSDGHLLSDALHDEAATPGAERQLAAGMAGGITFVATAQAHPDQWRDPAVVPAGSHAVLDGDFATAYPRQFPTAPGRPGRVDRGGDTIVGHDALQVVVEAVVRARPPQSDDVTQPVTAELVRQALGAITVYDPVRGASGPIQFRGAGYAVDKNIPFTTIDAAGTIGLGAPPARTR